MACFVGATSSLVGPGPAAARRAALCGRRAPVARARWMAEVEPTDALGPEKVSEQTAEESPALTAKRDKYLYPMRDTNTQIFFDNYVDSSTVMVVFAEDRHGLVLDTLSILEDHNVQVRRFASAESESMKLLLPRMEQELVSLQSLGLALENCCAWYISDDAGDKIYDPRTLDTLATAVRSELDSGPARPNQSNLAWHRTVVHKIRSNPHLSSVSIQTFDRGNLLADLTRHLDQYLRLEITSASIKTFETRVEDIFFVRDAVTKLELQSAQIEPVSIGAVRAAVCQAEDWATRQHITELWYQYREFPEICVLEVVEVSPEFLQAFPSWRTEETPSLRGRLQDSPYGLMPTGGDADAFAPPL